MVDPRTHAYLKELAKAVEQNKRAVSAAEQICTCADCIDARIQKQVSQCDKNRLLSELPEKIIPPYPDNFVPELSPNYFEFASGKRRSF